MSRDAEETYEEDEKVFEVHKPNISEHDGKEQDDGHDTAFPKDEREFSAQPRQYYPVLSEQEKKNSNEPPKSSFALFYLLRGLAILPMVIGEVIEKGIDLPCSFLEKKFENSKIVSILTTGIRAVGNLLAKPFQFTSWFIDKVNVGIHKIASKLTGSSYLGKKADLLQKDSKQYWEDKKLTSFVVGTIKAGVIAGLAFSIVGALPLIGAGLAAAGSAISGAGAGAASVPVIGGALSYVAPVLGYIGTGFTAAGAGISTAGAAVATAQGAISGALPGVVASTGVTSSVVMAAGAGAIAAGGLVLADANKDNQSLFRKVLNYLNPMTVFSDLACKGVKSVSWSEFKQSVKGVPDEKRVVENFSKSVKKIEPMLDSVIRQIKDLSNENNPPNEALSRTFSAKMQKVFTPTSEMPGGNAHQSQPLLPSRQDSTTKRSIP